MNTATQSNKVTILGAFHNWTDAHNFKKGLNTLGISNDSIRTTPRNESDAASTHLGEEDKGFWQSLKDLFSDDDTRNADYYAETTRRGGILVHAVVAESQVDEVQRLATQNNAINMNDRGAHYQQQGFTGYDESRYQTTADERRTYSEQDRVIPVTQEEINVDKRSVAGGVRVVRRVIETPVEEQVTLHKEHVDVQRRPADRKLSADEADRAFKEENIDVQTRNEEAVVSKNARVVEEVVVNKDSHDETETVRDKVRKTDVDVEKTTGQKTGAGTKR